ncbi:MAG: helicase, partial [Pseudomonadota bacterium]
TREVEDRLSDALHERLMQRFVDRRTSALLKSLNSEDDIAAQLDEAGDVHVEGHLVGRLEGLDFKPAVTAQTLEGRAVRNAAVQALRSVIEAKLAGIAAAEDRAFSLDTNGYIRLEDEIIAKLARGADWLSPDTRLIGGDDASQGLRDVARARLNRWSGQYIETVLAPIFQVKRALDGARLSGLARGTAHQLVDAGAAIDRRKDGVTAALKREDREALKEVGVRTGRIAAYMPGLLKPAQADLCLTLRALFDDKPRMTAPGAASFPTEKGWSQAMLSAAGYVRLGGRAVRADMVERLSWALGRARNAADGSAFAPPPELAALIGCPGDEFPDVLRAIGMKPARRDKETGAPDLWRFASQKRKHDKAVAAKTKAVEDSAFAALAALASPIPETERPAKKKRRRKPKRAPIRSGAKPSADAPSTSSANAETIDGE